MVLGSVNAGKTDEVVKAAASRANVLACVFAGGLVVLLSVLHLNIFPVPSPRSYPEAQILRVLFVLSVVKLLAAPFVFRIIFRHSLRDRSKEELGRSFVLATLISFALRETVAFYGIALTVLTGERAWGETLTVAALTAMVLSWPRETLLSGRIKDGF